MKTDKICWDMIGRGVLDKTCGPIHGRREVAILGLGGPTNPERRARVLPPKSVNVLGDMGIQYGIGVKTTFVRRGSRQRRRHPVLRRAIHFIAYFPLRLCESLINDDVLEKCINVLVVSWP